MAIAPQSPLVTIGVPVYNGERYLAASLDSLLAQTYEDVAILVLDNASVDRTPQIAQEYVRKDSRVRYLRNPVNIGGANNFRKAFELSETPYFRWAAADDLCAPEFIERCMAVMLAHPDVVQVYPRTLIIDATGAVSGKYADGIHTVADKPSDRYRHVYNNVALCNAIFGVIRSDVLRRTAIHGNYIGSDIPLQAEIALYGKIWELPEYLFMRRMHAEGQALMSETDRARHYQPDGQMNPRTSLIRHLAERFKSVSRAPISLSEKARVSAFLARRAIRNRDILSAQLLTAVRSHFVRTTP